MPAQEEAEKSHHMNRDEQFGIPTSLAPRACTDFLWSLGTNCVQQPFRDRNSSNFSTLLNTGIWHQLYPADPTSKRNQADGTDWAQLTNGASWHCEMLSAGVTKGAKWPSSYYYWQCIDLLEWTWCDLSLPNIYNYNRGRTGQLFELTTPTRVKIM